MKRKRRGALPHELRFGCVVFAPPSGCFLHFVLFEFLQGRQRAIFFDCWRIWAISRRAVGWCFFIVVLETDRRDDDVRLYWVIVTHAITIDDRCLTVATSSIVSRFVFEFDQFLLAKIVILRCQSR